jgi:hypothetical protein
MPDDALSGRTARDSVRASLCPRSFGRKKGGRLQPFGRADRAYFRRVGLIDRPSQHLGGFAPILTGSATVLIPKTREQP